MKTKIKPQTKKDWIAENRDKIFKRFEKEARYRGNGIYEFAGICHNDTGELFEQGLSNQYEIYLQYFKRENKNG